ncbi:MAG: hypothetical protein IMY72_04435 [Bacteroidetes bacterium]|nr:hypothetical protein [Bacteroidota bacterium]
MKRTNVSYLASILLTAVFLTSCGGLNKMVKLAPEVRYSVTPEILSMHGDSIEITLKGTFPAKYFNKKAILSITPVLKYEAGEKIFESKTLQGEDAQANNQVISFVSGGSFDLTSKIPYTEDMKISDLELRVKASIKDKSVDVPTEKVADGVIATANLLEKDPKSIKADDKFVRVTTQSKGADIHFIINKANIRNSEIKAEDMTALKNYVKEASEKSNYEFKGIDLLAYASPDGAIDLNTKLAAKRLKNTKKYFGKQLKRNKIEAAKEGDFFQATSTPEDWDGFQKLMQNSEIQDKDLILRVLSMYSDPDVREKEIKNISAAYTIIADKIMPQLRRSQLKVNISIVGYSDSILTELSKTNPDTLNLEELMYSATLTEDLNEQLNIYKTVVKKYPECLRGHNNVGYVNMKLNKLDEAKASFEEAKKINANNAMVLNNLGVIAYLNNDIEAAQEYYNAAAGAKQGNEISYNQAIIKVKNGNYEDALNLFASSKFSTFNFALAKFLNFKNTQNADAFEASMGILKKIDNQDNALIYYLKAIIGAHQQNADLIYNNLRTAIEKDASIAGKAKKDIEFAKYFEDETFKSIVQ